MFLYANNIHGLHRPTKFGAGGFVFWTLKDVSVGFWCAESIEKIFLILLEYFWVKYRKIDFDHFLFSRKKLIKKLLLEKTIFTII